MLLLDAVAKAIDRFEDYSKFRDFQEVSRRTGACLQGASKDDAECENRSTFIGVHHLLRHLQH